MRLAMRFKVAAGVLSLLAVLAGLVTNAQAVVLMYEGFDYAKDPVAVNNSLNGKTGGTGFAAGSAWTAGNTNTYPAGSPSGFAICDAATQTLWNGTVTSVPQTGNFAGSPAPAGNAASGYNGNNPDHLWASRPLDPNVTATFTLGAVTWMSYVEASNFKANANGTGASFCIGKGKLDNGAGTDNRGWTSYGGWDIGIGVNSAKQFVAGIWDATTGALGGPASAAWNTTGVPQIGIAKIVWGDATTPTTIYQATFNDGTTLTEAAFDAAAKSNSNATNLFNPLEATYVVLGGARYNVDELRIGTTFNDAIGVVVAATGNYWAPEATGGGTGTWSSTSNVWSANPNSQGTGGQAGTGELIFSGAAGTVTIDGTVSAVAGLQFQTDGYSVVPGTSSPNLSLSGTSAGANTITVNSGKTATITAELTGSNGMTKSGAGTLVLGNAANTFGGGTVLSAGVLQIADVGSLGSGNVTFQGGTLQYAPGTGATTIDVSGRIPTVASGMAAKIDTNGNDVTFGTAIGGEGGLTKVGSGSLTLGAANTYTGPTSVSGGTLHVGGASGTVATLNVLAGGTANLNAGAAITALNVTGGTANTAGTGATVQTLKATSGTLVADTHPLTVTSSASLGGVTVSQAMGGPAFTLSGSNLVSPTALSRNTLSANGGTLSFVGTGLAAAIGIASPGAATVPATATFSGNGVWTLSGGAAADLGNVYGIDNHAFQYMQVGQGDFDIKVHVTGSTNARVGLMARDSLASATGNWAGIWSDNQAAIIKDGVLAWGNANTGGTPYLQITKVGNLVTTYYSTDGGLTYTQAQQLDASTSLTGWGPTTYLGLDLTGTSGAVGSASGAFDNVNFMGTASMSDWSTSDIAVTASTAVVLPAGTVTFGGLSFSDPSQQLTLSGAARVNFDNISGNGSLTNGGSAYMTVALTNGSGVYGGIISDGASGKIALAKSGSGTLVLTGNNTYTGATTITGGTLEVRSVGGGKSSIDNTSGVQLSNAATLAFNHADALAFGKPIAGDGSLVKSGAGTLTLGGVSSHTGATAVNEGKLVIGQGGSMGAATAVSVANIATYGVSQTSGGTVSAGGTLGMVPGATLDMQDGVFNTMAFAGSGNIIGSDAGVNVQMDLGTSLTQFDNVLFGAASSISGKINFSFNTFGSLENGRYLIVSAPLGLSGECLPFLLGDAVRYGHDLALELNPERTAIVLNISTAAVATGSYWAPVAGGGGSGTWTAASTTWAASAGSSGPGTLAQSTTSPLVFTNAAGTVTIGGGGVTASGLQFDTAGYTLAAATSADTLTLTGAAAVVANQDATISAVISGTAGLAKSGAGTLLLTAANNYTGTTAISGGKLQVGTGGSGASLGTGMVLLSNNAKLAFNHADALVVGGLIGGTGSVTKSGGGTLTLTGNNYYTGTTTVTAGTLVLGANAQSPVLSLAGGADLQQGKIVFQSGDAATIKDLLTASYKDPLGKWQGGKFLSTTAPTTGLTLGWKDDAGNVTVMATYAGDANLDGSVDGIDLDVWKANVGSSTANFAMADLNYDGSVDGLDLDLWKATVGSSGAGGSTASAPVPEPGTLVLLAMGLLGLLAWRRK